MSDHVSLELFERTLDKFSTTLETILESHKQDMAELRAEISEKNPEKSLTGASLLFGEKTSKSISTRIADALERIAEQDSNLATAAQPRESRYKTRRPSVARTGLNEINDIINKNEANGWLVEEIIVTSATHAIVVFSQPR